MISASEITHGKILIVDDMEVNILLLERMLRAAGYMSITSTREPDKVCELHRQHRYDLILLDLHMPGMDGFQVMEELKKIEKGGYLPVLVITAHPDLMLRALAAGAHDFVSKPFDLVEVQARIHNMLEVRLLYKKLEHANSLLQSLALHDELTGLPNRRLLMDRISLAIAHARRINSTMAVMFLDLDAFKLINDSFGHHAGDEVLCMVAARLLAVVRQEDTVARLGGDEFVIVLPELTHCGGVSSLAAKLVQAVSQPYRIQGHSVSITTSIGVSIYPAHGEEAEALMKCADLALYEAKRKGKNDYGIGIAV